MDMMEVAIIAVIATRSEEEEFSVPSIIEVVMFNADERVTMFKYSESKHRHLQRAISGCLFIAGMIVSPSETMTNTPTQ